jgi:hypothetical protein
MIGYNTLYILKGVRLHLLLSFERAYNNKHTKGKKNVTKHVFFEKSMV